MSSEVIISDNLILAPQSRTPKNGSQVDLRLISGKYRDPIPVPVSEEERARWKEALHKFGRIKCLECGCSYTTSLGMDYHYQRCNKIEYGYKCLKCGLCFTRTCHKLLLGHISSCYEIASSIAIDTTGRSGAKTAKSHVLSKNDYTEFTRRHYVGDELANHIVHPNWR